MSLTISCRFWIAHLLTTSCVFPLTLGFTARMRDWGGTVFLRRKKASNPTIAL